jgi:hypothetical protein
MNIVTPHRTAHTYTQQLEGTPGQVFPLLCPVREYEWVNGWDPGLVVTESGAAELDCIFTTGDGDQQAVWVVTRYEPPGFIEFVKINPHEMVGRISIVLRPDGSDRTFADVTYAFTALNDRGIVAVDAFTADYYTEFMQEWEIELNHFLRTGTKLNQGIDANH